MRSDCYPIWLNMHSHSREATATTCLINMQRRSREATVAQSQSQSDCYPILLNMQSHSRKATVMPRRCGIAASIILVKCQIVFVNYNTEKYETKAPLLFLSYFRFSKIHCCWICGSFSMYHHCYVNSDLYEKENILKAVSSKF